MKNENKGFSDLILRFFSFVTEYNCCNFKRRSYNRFFEVYTTFLDLFSIVN